MRVSRKLLIATALLVLAAARSSQGQAPSRPAQNTDQLGMTCAKVLALSSSDYIAKYVAIDDSNLDGPLRGIGRYGKCYDARTDSIAALLARSRRGPTKSARDDFAAFESALKNFTMKALATVPPAPNTAKEAYANLYEKQFRREFYAQYELKAAPAAKSSPAAPASGTTTPPSGAKPSTAAPQSAEERARSDADPVTQAKNHFGKILNALPEDKMHELHAAFGEVIGPHALNEAIRLAVYRYAIFLLEPPSAKPFAPPPF